MIRRLKLRDVGPARDLEFTFSPRLNVLTGDNGLGKTFVLDVVWWALTTTWAGEKAFPFRPLDGIPGAGRADGSGYYGGGAASGAGRADGSGYGGGSTGRTLDPQIQATIVKGWEAASKPIEADIHGWWSWARQEWIRTPQNQGRIAPLPRSSEAPSPSEEAQTLPQGLVIYAQVDGSFAVFDSYYAQGGADTFSEAAMVLSSSELWDGKDVIDPQVQGGRRTVIEGLISDWVRWQQRAKSPEFETLCEVLRFLSPPDEPMTPSEPVRVHLRDRRDIPAVRTRYGVVPVTLASSGMKRALALAYLLVWAWTEHAKAAEASRRPTTRSMVLLIDEPELHQHPAWQRMFLPAVLRAIDRVAPHVAVQVVSTTHAPLVLASVEPFFDTERDQLFLLDLEGQQVVLEDVAWSKQGDVVNWLVSETFGLQQGRSLEAEKAIEAAEAWMRGEIEGLPEGLDTQEKIDDELKRVLAGHDPFWPRWVVWAEAHGSEAR